MHYLDDRGAQAVHLGGDLRVVHLRHAGEKIFHEVHPLTTEANEVDFVPNGRAKQHDARDGTEGSWRGFLCEDGKSEA